MEVKELLSLPKSWAVEYLGNDNYSSPIKGVIVSEDSKYPPYPKQNFFISQDNITNYVRYCDKSLLLEMGILSGNSWTFFTNEMQAKKFLYDHNKRNYDFHNKKATKFKQGMDRYKILRDK